MSTAESSHLLVEGVVNKAVAPAICVFGIIGNLLNLVVLTRKRLQCSMDRSRSLYGPHRSAPWIAWRSHHTWVWWRWQSQT